VIVKVPTTP